MVVINVDVLLSFDLFYFAEEPVCIGVEGLEIVV